MGSYGLTGIYLRLSHRNNKNGKAVISATKFEDNFAVIPLGLSQITCSFCFVSSELQTHFRDVVAISFKDRQSQLDCYGMGKYVLFCGGS